MSTFPSSSARIRAAATTSLLVVASLAAATGFAADPPSTPPDRPPPQHQRHRHHHDPAMLDRHLDEIKGELKLQPDQQAAWQTFATAMKAQREQMHGRFEAMRAGHDQPGALPERLDRQLARMQQGLADMEQSHKAIKSFYSVLTPEQQKIMDQRFMRRHRPMA